LVQREFEIIIFIIVVRLKIALKKLEPNSSKALRLFLRESEFGGSWLCKSRGRTVGLSPGFVGIFDKVEQFYITH